MGADRRAIFEQRMQDRIQFVSKLHNLSRDSGGKPKPDDKPSIYSSGTLIDELYKSILEQRSRVLDVNAGMHSRFEVVDGRRVWLRVLDKSVTPGASKKHSESAVEKFNYIRQFYAYLIAALNIAEMHTFGDVSYIQRIKELQEQAQQLLTDVGTAADTRSADDVKIQISELKGTLLRLVDAQWTSARPDYARDKNAINKMLDQAKDWVALEHPSLTIATVIKNTGKQFEDRSMIVLDEPCAELTKEQRHLFDVADGKQAWFQTLSKFHQKLVLHYKDKILKGDRVVPSQLRAVVPLLKNAYCQTVYAQEKSSVQFELLNTYYHTGTPAFLNHQHDKDATAKTAESLKQMYLNSHADAALMITLNSSLADTVLAPIEKLKGQPYVADDSKIIHLIGSAVRELQKPGDRRSKSIVSAKICLNDARAVELNDYSGVEEILRIVDKAISAKGKDPCLDKQEIVSFKKLEMYLKKVRELKSKISLRDKEVKGLDIIFMMTKMAAIYNALVLGLRRKDPAVTLKTIAVWFGCASGENRTGITYYNTLLDTLHFHFCRKGDSQVARDEKYQAINAMVCQSQHIDVITAASTLTKEGISGKSKGSFKGKHSEDKLVKDVSKSMGALDAEFNQALNELRAQIATAKTSMLPEMKKVLVYAGKLASYAERDKTNVVVMPEKERQAYIDAISAVNQVLKAPGEVNAVSALLSASKALDEFPVFKRRAHPSVKMSVGGLVMCIAGAALLVVAVASFMVTLGMSTFMSGAVALIGSALIAKAATITAMSVGGGLFVGGSCLGGVGLFRRDRGIQSDMQALHKSALCLPKPAVT